MRSRATETFWKLFANLPADVQRQAKAAFGLWRADPFHPSLQFKRVHRAEPLYSVRVGLHWRALCLRDGDLVNWIWIGSHADYDKLLR